MTEPAFFLGLLVLAKLSGSLQLAGMFGGSLASHWTTAGASLALVLLSWFIVLLAENSRIPFDDPNTHLELTMIHEVMVLDHSGPALGMILYGAALKLFVLGALVVRLAFPVSTGIPWLDWPLFVAGMLVVAVTIGVVESTMARLRLTHVPILLVAACLLSAFGVILLLR
jgi:formate hydrogenlyase subunit 4